MMEQIVDLVVAIIQDQQIQKFLIQIILLDLDFQN